MTALQPDAPLSRSLRQRGLHTWEQACAWVHALPYGRIPDRNRPETLLAAGCGTCSSKHAFLYLLAQENAVPGIRLMFGVFRMHAANTPATAAILRDAGLAYMPELHTYLEQAGAVLDLTAQHLDTARIHADMLDTWEATVADTGDAKIGIHQAWLQAWRQREGIPMPLAELWQVREACIAALSSPS